MMSESQYVLKHSENLVLSLHAFGMRSLKNFIGFLKQLNHRILDLCSHGLATKANVQELSLGNKINTLVKGFTLPNKTHFLCRLSHTHGYPRAISYNTQNLFSVALDFGTFLTVCFIFFTHPETLGLTTSPPRNSHTLTFFLESLAC